MRKILTHPATCSVVLLAAILVCFGRTLNSYFLADDFGEVAYVAKIYEGDLNRLWSNFTGNYMQVPSMAVYRPWLLMTLLFDFAIWKVNAFGFYLTNILHYCACTLLIFAIVRLLTGDWGRLRSTLAALFSGLLFAVSPLHCESVSWVVGRVDIVCLTYYLSGLLSVALYLRRDNKKWLVLTFASFWLGILTKEMAIGLPITATLMALLWGKRGGFANGHLDFTPASATSDRSAISNTPPSGSTGQGESPYEISRATAVAALQKLEAAANATSETVSERGSIKSAIAEKVSVATPVAAMLFGCTILYFIIRYACLGTITGGYTGSIGQSQFTGILEKWTDLDTIMRIVFPFNQFAFTDSTTWKIWLSFAYMALAALVSTRLLAGQVPRPWLVFILGATAVSLAPIYQLWGIGYNLEGSRFVFFLTVPLAMLLPLILFAPLSAEQSMLARRILVLAVAALSALTIINARITLRNNVPWVHAGKQTEALTLQAQALFKSTGDGEKVCVVGIPKDEGGAHMILNGATFRHLITTPFAPAQLTGKILTFEPHLFGNPEKINTGHFKYALAEPKVKGFYVWDMDKREFISFNPGRLPAPPVPIKVKTATLEMSQAPPTVLAEYPYTRLRGSMEAQGKIKDAMAGFGMRISNFKLMPSQFDYLAIAVEIPEGSTFTSNQCKIRLDSVDKKKAEFAATFSATNSQIRVPLSAYWRFFAAGEISALEVDFPPISEIKVKQIELLPAIFVAPMLTAGQLRTADDGSLTVDKRTSSANRTVGAVQVSVDASALQNAQSVELQIFKPNFFLDNLSSEAALESGTYSRLNSAAPTASITLPNQIVEKSGFVQMRARALNAAGEQVGEYSYPLTLRVLND